MHLSYAQTQHIHSHILLHSREHFGRTTALRGIQGLLAYYEDRKEISLSPFSSGHTNHWWLHTLIPRIVTSWKCSEVAPHLSAFSGKVPYFMVTILSTLNGMLPTEHESVPRALPHSRTGSRCTPEGKFVLVPYSFTHTNIYTFCSAHCCHFIISHAWLIGPHIMSCID